MPRSLPAISGKQLIRLLKKDGYIVERKAKHGLLMNKKLPSGRTIVTVIPDKSKPLPPGTLSDILGPKNTGLGRKSLRALIDEYGL